MTSFRSLGLGLASLVLSSFVMGCSGDDGSAGQPGDSGKPVPTVSAESKGSPASQGNRARSASLAATAKTARRGDDGEPGVDGTDGTKGETGETGDDGRRAKAAKAGDDGRERATTGSPGVTARRPAFAPATSSPAPNVATAARVEVGLDQDSGRESSTTSRSMPKRPPSSATPRSPGASSRHCQESRPPTAFRSRSVRTAHRGSASCSRTRRTGKRCSMPVTCCGTAEACTAARKCSASTSSRAKRSGPRTRDVSLRSSYRYSELVYDGPDSYYTTNYSSFGGLISAVKNGQAGTYALTPAFTGRRAHTIAFFDGVLYGLLAQKNVGLTLSTYPKISSARR